jgi:aerobic-type carbon monoxide dehydrogenase small subunit (CoxS/CutS family)
MTEKISFTINGVPRTVEVNPDLPLLDIIRDMLDLTGTKRGCDNSTCGTCVVVVNGKAVKSCNFPTSKAQGAVILTVEGISKGMELHPVQKALSESGAVQCGFCTPGIVMELYALLEEKPEAAEVEMVNALNKHLCRCNGYEPILNGARVAQELVKGKKR